MLNARMILVVIMEKNVTMCQNTRRNSYDGNLILLTSFFFISKDDIR